MKITIGPLVLIALGCALLLVNLDLLPVGKLKALALTWWPVVLIVVGLLQLRKR